MDYNYVETNNRTFYFGLLERIAPYGTIFPTFADKINPIPEPFWYSYSLRRFVPKVLDQDGQSSCTGAATVAAIMTCRNQAGFPFIELSIGSIYGQINGGIDGGSFLSSALLAAHQTGACPIDVIPHMEWNPAYWPQDWRDKAKCFRILEAYDCQSFEDIVSAILLGFPVCYGIFLSKDDIIEVSKDGFLPLYSRNRKYGHAVLGVGIKRYKNTWWVETLSSWGENWANGGFCFVPPTFFEKDLLDAWAIRATTVCLANNHSVCEASS